MLETLRDLMAHKWYADAAVVTAIRQNDDAAADPEVRELLLHILLANRFWLLTILGQPFVLDVESEAPASFDALLERYRGTQQQESSWLAKATETDLARTVTSHFIPGATYSVFQALMQVCMHSHGHRAQCAKLFRRHGGQPPMTDFILWLPTRPAPEWWGERSA